MSKVIGVSGLIGTQDYLIPYKRVSTEALELTPSWRKTNYNGYDVTDVPVAGIIPVSVTLNGDNTGFSYKEFSFVQALTDAVTQTISPLDYAVLEEGTYYSNQSTGEIFYCLVKGENYTVTLKRGILNTPVSAITTTAVIDIMNTIRLDDATGTETAGVFTLTKGTAPMIAGDEFTIAVDGILKTYVMGTDIAVGADATAQATNIRNVLAQDYINWSFAVSSDNVVATQKSGYAHPFSISFTCVAATAANAWTGALTTAGVSKVYSSGFGFIIYKEMPRNLINGQNVYPAYNYNVDGK